MDVQIVESENVGNNYNTSMQLAKQQQCGNLVEHYEVSITHDEHENQWAGVISLEGGGIDHDFSSLFEVIIIYRK